MDLSKSVKLIIHDSDSVDMTFWKNIWHSDREDKREKEKKHQTGMLLSFHKEKPRNKFKQEIKNGEQNRNKDEIYVNGEKLQIISGSIHYFRVVPDYWRDRWKN